MRRSTIGAIAAGAVIAAGWGTAGAMASTSDGTPGALPGITVPIPVGVAASHCTDPATGEWVIPGDAILNNGQESVCTGSILVTVLPPGLWVRTVTGHIGDCGPGSLSRKHPGVIVGYGPGDDTSALICPPLPYGNGTVNPS